MIDTATRPLSPAEISDWVEGLGASPLERAQTTADLLRHANEDGMSPDDRRICIEALTILRDSLIPPVEAHP